ncbi:hypothetical protein EUGRSUZ_F03204 [Eucalyptus grandis]|uniref:RING-type domain-containing protein n=2 Tax=Eucalyptus grandis TaxID=71139 RepID=A0A059BW47_EUCGR|nr:hypothetical protein EUGRSUZ_F03204 [Eucalyptus grandis]
MGNKLGRRRQVVDEKYTRPQGLYHHKDVDIKRLRKLILESKLAPCYPGDEESTCDLEECPICFLYYPSLNRSRCCTKGICTECFLQMKIPNSTRPTPCPFCKTSNYAVEYRGVKTKEEKGIEQIEEQRVIEAKIRMRQKELQDEEERMQKRQDLSSSSRTMAPVEIDNGSVGVQSRRSPVDEEEIVSADQSYSTSISRQPPHLRTNRDDEFDLDLEDIMVMEAIWLSIQEKGKFNSLAQSEAAPSEQYVSEDHYVSQATAPLAGSGSSPSGGLACAIAALAERQQMSGESSFSHNTTMSTYNVPPNCGQFYPTAVQDSDGYAAPESGTTELVHGGGIPLARDDGEWNMDRGSEVAEAGTSYASSDSPEDAGGISALPQPNEVDVGFQNIPAPIVPESFEEQMMLAMAVSLAEARAVTSGPGITWQ